METILKRRSIRSYKNKKIEKEKIEKLLRAAMQAPSAMNQQPWEFIVVQEEEKLKELSKMSVYSKVIKKSAVSIVLLANKKRIKYPENWQQDMSAASENILLEAVDLDLGGVWLGVAPLEERMIYIRKIFDLSENIMPFSVISLGYPENAENKFIDRFDETRIKYL